MGGRESTIITLQQAEETQNPVLTAISPIPYPPHANNRRILFQEKNTARNPKRQKYKKITAMCVGISEQTENSGIIFPAEQYSCCCSSKGVDWSLMEFRLAPLDHSAIITLGGRKQRGERFGDRSHSISLLLIPRKLKQQII